MNSLSNIPEKTIKQFFVFLLIGFSFILDATPTSQDVFISIPSKQHTIERGDQLKYRVELKKYDQITWELSDEIISTSDEAIIDTTLLGYGTFIVHLTVNNDIYQYKASFQFQVVPRELVSRKAAVIETTLTTNLSQISVEKQEIWHLKQLIGDSALIHDQKASRIPQGKSDKIARGTWINPINSLGILQYKNLTMWAYEKSSIIFGSMNDTNPVYLEAGTFRLYHAKTETESYETFLVANSITAFIFSNSEALVFQKDGHTFLAVLTGEVILTTASENTAKITVPAGSMISLSNEIFNEDKSEIFKKRMIKPIEYEDIEDKIFISTPYLQLEDKKLDIFTEEISKIYASPCDPIEYLDEAEEKEIFQCAEFSYYHFLYNQAEELFIYLINMNETYAPPSHAYLSQLYLNTQRWQEAIDQLEKKGKLENRDYYLEAAACLALQKLNCSYDYSHYTLWHSDDAYQKDSARLFLQEIAEQKSVRTHLTMDFLRSTNPGYIPPKSTNPDHHPLKWKYGSHIKITNEWILGKFDTTSFILDSSLDVHYFDGTDDTNTIDFTTKPSWHNEFSLFQSNDLSVKLAPIMGYVSDLKQNPIHKLGYQVSSDFSYRQFIFSLSFLQLMLLDPSPDKDKAFHSDLKLRGDFNDLSLRKKGILASVGYKYSEMHMGQFDFEYLSHLFKYEGENSFNHSNLLLKFLYQYFYSQRVGFDVSFSHRSLIFVDDSVRIRELMLKASFKYTPRLSLSFIMKQEGASHNDADLDYSSFSYGMGSAMTF